jgi:hypothetical protein
MASGCRDRISMNRFEGKLVWPVVLVILIIPALLPLCSQTVLAGPGDDWQLTIEMQSNAPAWSGIHDDKPITDLTYLVQVKVLYKTQPVKGATVIADIRSSTGQPYWFKDGTGYMYDTVQYDGRDDRGKQVGTIWGNLTNDGIYSNLIEVGEQYSGTDPDWNINMTVYAPGLPIQTRPAHIHLVPPAQGYGHHIRSVDLDSSTQKEEWLVMSHPGQNLTGKIILDESPSCASGCCPYHISAWGAPFGTWGQEYRVSQGCMSERRNVSISWNYTVPNWPGHYLLTLSDTTNAWWASYNESVVFVGNIIVQSGPASPKVELVSPANGTKIGTYIVPLQWKGSGFSPLRPSYIVLMDGIDGRSVTLTSTEGTSTTASFTENVNRKWSVIGYDGLTKFPSTVWEFSVERNISADKPPTAKLASPGNFAKSKYHDTTFNWSGTDPEGDLITYTFEVRYSLNRTLIATRDMMGTNTKVWLPEGDLVWTVIPRDPWKTGSCLDGYWALTIAVPPNTAPYSILIFPPSGKVFGNQSIDFRWDGFDAEGDVLQYKLEVRDAFTGDLYVERYVYTKNVTLWLPPWSYTWTVIPSDGQLWGWCKNGTWSLAVTGPLNRQPVITSRPPDNAVVGKEYKYQIVAKDPDGDHLTYSLLEGPANMSMESRTGMVAWTPGPNDLGVKEISFLVLDGHGGKSIQTFDLNIAKDMGPVPSKVESSMPSLEALVFVVVLTIVLASVHTLRGKGR